MLKINAFEIRRSYALGKRDFAQLDLSYASLQGVNLSHANLKGANLKGSDLTGSILKSANLEGANLQGANLNAADLCQANLKLAALDKAELLFGSLMEADLRKACLRDANLEMADLSYANLRGSDLSGASIRGSKLTETDFWGSFYNDRSLFDEGFDPDNVQMQPEAIVTVWELLGQLNIISNYGRRYLGNSIAAISWESTRPQIEWLYQFTVDRFARIAFTGRLTETVDTSQLQWSHSWTDAFIQHCAKIVPSLPKVIKQEQLFLI